MDGMQRHSDCACLAVTSIRTSTESVAMGFTGRGNKAEGFFKGKTTCFDLRTPTLCPRRPSNSRRPTTTNHSSPFWFVLPFSFKSKNSHLILKMFPGQKRKRNSPGVTTAESQVFCWHCQVSSAFALHQGGTHCGPRTPSLTLMLPVPTSAPTQ